MPILKAGSRERVRSVKLPVEWCPGAPEAILVAADLGAGAVLALEPHPDDPDQRCVVLSWPSAQAASMEPPNAEALAGHRLYNRGLKKIDWCGEVMNSAWIADLIRRNEVHDRHDPALFAGLRHYIVPLKESVVEVVATSIGVHRVAGATREAALAAL
jgi:hypothetical protein